ncbi:carbon-nitrogen hydrolase family protein [Oceanicola sp. 22II-s10i]|uniref:carbon-nitrogen hydrolase family protein n=1 Tax=Oceanicola sp. 22II-s10i TaxID=1317116 RepID=UPI000B528C90|nr:carbon-nitrogen hydrolase family protein [Oceanicola sp. 22II-s10i]
MKIAAASYPLDWFASWAEYEAKQTAWVSEAAGQGADLLVFPEYGAMELVSIAGEATAADTQRAMTAVSGMMPDANALHRDLAARFGVHILGGSGSVIDDGKFVNRAFFHTPTGQTGFQDKQIMTMWERDQMGVVGQSPLRLFDTALGKIAINICYDCQFPLLTRALREADLILIPSTTEAAYGYWRVRIGARARALETQCVTVMSSTIGPYEKLDLLATSHGGAGVFCPPDTGFPSDGILASAPQNQPGWTYAEVDPAAIARVRATGVVRNRSHWPESEPMATEVERITLR